MVFFWVILILLLPLPALSVTPLYYHTFAIAEIEATVEKISLTGVPTLKTDDFMRGKPLAESTQIMEVQKIYLKVKRVINLEKRDDLVAPVTEGEVIEVTNPFVDQNPPFKTGETIQTRIRLVLPEEKYDPRDPRKQWWFFPPGEVEKGFPPRRPFQVR